MAAELRLIERWPTGTDVCADAPLRLTFDRAPALGGTGRIEVCRTADGRPVETILAEEIRQPEPAGTRGEFPWPPGPARVDGTTVTIRLRDHSLEPGKSYFVRVAPGVFEDFADASGDWKFTIKAALPRGSDQVEVAANGSSDFCTVQAAVEWVDPHRARPTTIFIRKGRYEELVRVGRERTGVHLVGEDRRETVIASANNDRLHPGWLRRAVLAVEGDDFTLENLTVHNTTPPRGSQAEAVYINAERATLRSADLRSWQDTLHLSGSVRVSDCFVEGAVDYVWGYGSAFFERCELHSLHDGYIVQARNPPGKSGYVFVDCQLTAGPELRKCWLARIDPSRFPASHVAFIRCRMDAAVPEAGWLLNGPAGPALRFAEFQSIAPSGKPLDVSKRSPSSKQLSEKEAKEEANPARFFHDAGAKGGTLPSPEPQNSTR